MLNEFVSRELLNAEDKYDEACDAHGEESKNAANALHKLDVARRAALNQLLHNIAFQTVYGKDAKE